MGMESMMSGGGSVFGDLVTGWVNNQYAEDRQNSAQNFSAEQYAKRWQTTTSDMKAAGLNPMLAYSQGVGSSPSGSPASSNATPSLSQAYSRGSVASAQTANIEADTDNKKAQANLIEAQAAHAWASASQSTANVDLINQTVQKTIKETRNLDDEQTRLRAVYHNLAESSALMAQQNQTEVHKRHVLDATARKLLAEGNITRAEYDAMVDTGFIGVAAREVKVLSDVTSDWVDKALPWRQGKGSSEEHTDIVRDKHGREVGRSTYRSKR